MYEWLDVHSIEVGLLFGKEEMSIQISLVDN